MYRCQLSRFHPTFRLLCTVENARKLVASFKKEAVVPVSADMQISEIMNMLLPSVQECMRVGGGRVGRADWLGLSPNTFLLGIIF